MRPAVYEFLRAPTSDSLIPQETPTHSRQVPTNHTVLTIYEEVFIFSYGSLHVPELQSSIRMGRGVDAQEPASLRRPLDPHHRVDRRGEHHRRRDQRFSSQWEHDCHITETRRS